MKLGTEERSVAALHEYRKARLNPRFDAESASRNSFVIKSEVLNYRHSIKAQNFAFQHREGWMKLGTEERSVAALHEYRRARLNPRFDAESASGNNIVIKSEVLNYRYNSLRGAQDIHGLLR